MAQPLSPPAIEQAATDKVAASARDRVEEVYRHHAKRMWRALLAYTGNSDIASDALAEAFAQALRRGDAVRNVERWVWRAAFRIAAGELQKRRLILPEIDAPTDDPNPDFELRHAFNRDGFNDILAGGPGLIAVGGAELEDGRAVAAGPIAARQG